MKTSLAFTSTTLVSLALSFFLSPLDATTDKSLVKKVQMDTLKLDAPLAVKQIIKAKCYDCHAEGGDEEAVKNLLWDEFPMLHPEDKIYLFDKIIISIEDKEMPPADHLKEHPEDTLSAEEERNLIEWAAALAYDLEQG